MRPAELSAAFRDVVDTVFDGSYMRSILDFTRFARRRDVEDTREANFYTITLATAFEKVTDQQLLPQASVASKAISVQAHPYGTTLSIGWEALTRTDGQEALVTIPALLGDAWAAGKNESVMARLAGAPYSGTFDTTTTDLNARLQEIYVFSGQQLPITFDAAKLPKNATQKRTDALTPTWLIGGREMESTFQDFFAGRLEGNGLRPGDTEANSAITMWQQQLGRNRITTNYLTGNYYYVFVGPESVYSFLTVGSVTGQERRIDIFDDNNSSTLPQTKIRLIDTHFDAVTGDNNGYRTLYQ